MSLVTEPVMLLKTKAITSYSRKLSGSARIPIMLNLKRLSYGCEQAGRSMHLLRTFKAGRLLKTKEKLNGRGSKTRGVDENKALIKKLLNITENK
jgi:hypothetical protein